VSQFGHIGHEITPPEIDTKMTVSVVGTINKDVVIDPEGRRFESLGGIIYNTIVLALLCPDKTVLPIAYCGTDSFDELTEVLSDFHNVDFSGIVEHKGGCNENLLRYVNPERKEEVLTARVPPIDQNMIRLSLDSDLALLNFISGFDLGLDTARNLKSSFGGTVYMDVHSMTLGIGKNGARFEKRVENWREWASCADIIQMNKKEATLFAGVEKPPEQVSLLICQAGPGLCLVTLGGEGVLVSSFDEGIIEQNLVPAVPVDVRDTIGCGDVFAAAFISRFIEGDAALDCAKEANLYAGRCCESAGVEELKRRLTD
jgi:sugar/nucleoside kinase (ribokinase family)